MSFWSASSSCARLSIYLKLTALLTVSATLLHSKPAQADFGPVRPVSINSSEIPADDESKHCAISDNGRYVAFESVATNLTTGASSGRKQIYLRDRLLGTTVLVSASSDSGTSGGNGDSSRATIAISSEGHPLVAFQSNATNLVSGDTNGKTDIFIKDITTGVITQITHSSGDAEFPAMSNDGQIVAFKIRRPSGGDVYVYDRPNTTFKQLNLTSAGGLVNSDISGGPLAVSGNGQFVVFWSFASNLLTGLSGTENNDPNGRGDVFIYDRTTEKNKRISVLPLSGDFIDTDDALTPLSFGPGSISDDGRYVAFGLDIIGTGYSANIYLRDTQSLTTALIGDSVPSGELSKFNDQFGLSADGSIGVFHSGTVTNSLTIDLSRIYSVNIASGVTTLLDSGTATVVGDLRAPCMNSDGSVVAFQKNSVSQLYLREVDQCPADILKEDVGICGCGVADIDDDSDGEANCIESCPFDAKKLAPGICGCGADETGDSDKDGIDDCQESCPADVSKTTPGECGCGVKEADLNANAITDCSESVVRGPVSAKVKIRHDHVRVALPKTTGYQYLVRLKTAGRKIQQFVFTTRKALLKKLISGKRYKLSYQIVDVSGATPVYGPVSRPVSFDAP